MLLAACIFDVLYILSLASSKRIQRAIQATLDHKGTRTNIPTCNRKLNILLGSIDLPLIP